MSCHAEPLRSAAPRVSVLTLTFNRPKYLGRAIQSVVTQTYPSWEIVVVQDGSHQLTQEIVREWQGRGVPILYLHREQPGNIANACNYGIARARGEYVAILDDDDYWATPEKLARQVEFLDSHPDYVACGGGITVVDEHGTATLTYMKPREDADIRRRALWANPMGHSTVVFRKSAAESVGLYDESLAGFQDWDLFLKLGNVGKLYNFPEVFLYYTIWSGGGSFTQTPANTTSAVRIVRRHKDKYDGSWAALLLAYAYFLYARLPLQIRRSTFSFLSRLKKRLFSSETAQPSTVL